MIWYESNNKIVMSEFTANSWTKKDTIVSSESFFKNWADLPQVYYMGGDKIALSWLEMIGEGTYDYGINISVSSDKGQTWSDPIRPHRDTGKGEHGFVSFFTNTSGELGFIWLDGRHMGEYDIKTHTMGDMAVYTSGLSSDLKLKNETTLDIRVCECCPTAAVNTSVGPLVAFRDRDFDETRNIQLAFVNGIQSPRPINDDGWIVPGCPVNGPAMEENGEKVAISWYTAPDNKPQVNISFSTDGGLTFGNPIRLDGGSSIGRTDLIWLDDKNVLVSWLEEGEESGVLVLKTVNSSSGDVNSFKSFAISSGRGSGYPKLAMSNGFIFVAWTEPGEQSRIQSEWIERNDI